MIPYSFLTVFAANIVGFLGGTSLTWSSSEINRINDTNVLGRYMTDEESSWIGSLVPLGAIFGPFIFSFAADKFGRRWTILSCGVPFVISYALFAFAETIELFYFGRVFIGLAVGGLFTVLPMYIGEVADDSNRGALGSSFNCFICLGILFSYAVGPYVSVMVFNLILSILSVIYLVVFFIFGVESPHYSIKNGEVSNGEIILKKIRGSDNIKPEYESIKNSIDDAGTGSFLDIFKSKGLIKALVITISLLVFQQLSGINAVLFYASTIFQSAEIDLEPEICSIIIGATQFSTSFITPLISDRLGRKILLVISAVGMFISEIPLGVYFYLKDDDKDVSSISLLPVACLVIYIIVYNCGFGPLPWSVMGEMFPSNIKSAASAIASASCWFLGFLVTKYFKSMSDAIGMGPSYWMFAAFCFIAAIFSQFYVIETKGKSLDEIQEDLRK